MQLCDFRLLVLVENHCMKRLQILLAATLLAVAASSTTTTIEMTVNGLVCAFCAQGIEKKLHKPLAFGVAGALLAISGAALWAGRRAPCPADPDLARSCRRLRRISAAIYAIALICFAVGSAFAFVLPAL